MVYTENIRFEWDDEKAQANLKKHKISFEVAVTAFDDPNALNALDERHSTIHEIRELLIGKSEQGVLVVVFTLRAGGFICRLISARKANRRERKKYEKTR